ncbi:MAG: hypothetical protein R3B40_26025 [Polyangiales bacterium]
MGLFDSLLSRWRRFDDLEAPWRAGQAIHDALRDAAAPDGSLPEGYELPDTPEPDGEIRWASGALDGVMTHHAGLNDDAARAAAMAHTVAALTRAPSHDGLRALHEQVAQGPLIECVDDLVSAITQTDALDPDRLHALGRSLATRATEREMVKLGVLLVGLVEGTDDRELLLTLGAHDELALFVVVAMANRPDLGEQALWELARRTRGWGRIQSVERLAGTDDPAIKAWLLREGFRNTVMDEYLAHVCATTGGLAEALAHAPGALDDALLDGAADLLTALVTGGPAPDLAEYDHGALASERFLDHVEARVAGGAFSLRWLVALAQLRGFLVDDRPWDSLEARGWTDQRRTRLAAVVEALLAHPQWAAAVEGALDSDDRAARGQGGYAARLLDIDTFERLAARLEREPVDASTWHDLMRQLSRPERLERALAMVERLPLDAIATGPADELGLGPAFAAHACLDAIVPDLASHPGAGWPAIHAALRSPVVRNRNMALRTLAAWPRSAWPPGAAAALELARDEEPADDVRERIAATLTGQGLD